MPRSKRNRPPSAGSTTARPLAAWRWTGLVGAAALGLRLWHLLEYRHLPFFQVLQMDARFHAQWAQALLEHGWADPQVFFRAPFYPYFLAALQGMTGELFWTARIVQILIGTGTVVLVHRLALRLFPPRWALGAGLLAAFSWVPVHTETELLLEPVLTFQTTLLLFLMVRVLGRPPRWRDAFFWGLVTGLAAITRPNVLLFAPVVLVYAGWPRATGADPAARGRRRPVLSVGAACAGLLLPILPVWAHNARHGDAATWIAWQGGINLHLGNHAGANGWSAIAPGLRTDWRGSFEDAIRLAQERSGQSRRLRPSEVSRHWTREVARFWAENPGEALALTARKALLFWSATEIRNNEDPEFYRSRLTSLRFAPISFGLLAPFALIGLALAWRRGAGFRLLGLFTVAWFVSIVPFFVCSRYRLPIVPILPLLALAAVRTGVVERRQRRRAVLAWGAGVVLLYAVLLPPRSGVKDGGFFQGWNNVGDAWSEMGRWEDAAAAYRRALELNPRYVNSHNNLGLALDNLGRWPEAEQAFRAGLGVSPGHPVVRRNLATVLERQDRRPEAESLLVALVREPGSAWEDGLHLARVQEAAGRRAEAGATLRSLLSRYPDLTPARAGLAGLLRASGDVAGAREVLAEGLRRTPGNPELLRLARALDGTGMER